MNLFRLFKRKPKAYHPPIPVAVRQALEVAVYGMKPKVSPEEFESLYKDVLDSEVHCRNNAATIIDNFQKQREKHD